ncbi:MAG: Do family serine endopeptidase [Acidobacteriota bacterium]
MNPTTKRILSTTAIIIASIAFGIVVSADLGFMKQSSAQSSPIQTSSGPVVAVTIPSFADVAARVMPAVVSITSTEVIKPSAMRRNSPFGGVDPFEFFFPDPQRRPQPRRQPTPDDGEDDERKQIAGGSGFIISADGYILTNNHVIENSSKVQVHYGSDENGNGGHTVEAKIVGRDPATDIALLKIDEKNLPNINLGDSDGIRKGDWAIAVGNPFQFENTLTVGVISAKGRSLGLSEQTKSFENFIQTDAAINFGNSGGPLININGEVVGINTAIRGGGAQGIGFATPINTAKRLLPMLRSGKVTRGYLGMSIMDVDDRVKEGFGLTEARGALVQKVEPGKPADQAGIQKGDVIVEADGHPIRNNRELIDYISYQPVGAPVKVTLIRDGQRKVVTAKTAERPPDGEPSDEEPSSASEPTRNKLGMAVQNITPQLRQLYGIEDNIHGVVVTDVKEVSAAGDILSEGEVITEVQGQAVTNADQFRAAIDKLKGGQTARIYVITPGRRGQSVSGYRFLKVP